MNKKIRLNKTLVIIVFIGAVLVIWLGLLLSPALSCEATLFEKVNMMQIALNTPLAIVINESSK